MQAIAQADHKCIRQTPVPPAESQAGVQFEEPAEAAPQKELFYTEGPQDLKAARLHLAHYSLQVSLQQKRACGDVGDVQIAGTSYQGRQ